MNLSIAHTVESPTGSMAQLHLPGNVQAYCRGHHDVVTILKREDGQGYLVLERRSSFIHRAVSPWDAQDMAHFTCSSV